MRRNHWPEAVMVCATCALFAVVFLCIHSENLAKIEAAERLASAYAECLP